MNSTYFDEISTCDKRGYLDTNEDMGTFLEYTKLKNHLRVFIKGEESVMNNQLAFTFQTWNMEYLYSRIQILLQSGIYILWKKNIYMYFPNFWEVQSTNIRKSYTEGLDKPISTSAIQTAFYIHFFGPGISAISLVIENYIITHGSQSMEEFIRLLLFDNSTFLIKVSKFIKFVNVPPTKVFA